MDEIKRIFNYKVKLFNSVTINKISETWVFIYAEKSMDLGYDDVSPMIHMKASQILYSAKTKPVSEIYNKS